MTTTELTGAVVRRSDFAFTRIAGGERAVVVGPHVGARLVRLDVIRLDPGTTWTETDSQCEQVVLVYAGGAAARVMGQLAPLVRGQALYCPTGHSYRIRAGEHGVELYRWRSVLTATDSRSGNPRTLGALFDDTTQLRNFAGTGQVAPTDRIATMNFVFWPGTGSARLCLHCGIQQPGETFSVHLHQHSEDAFIAFEGAGAMYLADRWIEVTQGDVLFAPPMVLHGARNPHVGPDAVRFVTCGGPTPFDTFLYDAAGLSAEVR